MYFVYLIQSESFPSQKYYGITPHLESRIKDHNSGKSPHTSKYMPRKLVAYIAFSDKSKAHSFERYIKSHAGRAFANKHLW